MNKVILYGNLTRDPEVRVIEANGKKTSVVNFTIATSRHFRKRDGERDQETTFVACEAWDTGAETIGKYLVKGSPLLVEGSLKEDRWEDKESGQPRSRMKVRVLTFQLLGGKRQGDKDKEEPDKTSETPDKSDVAEPQAEKAPF